MKEQRKKSAETKDIEVDLEKIGGKIVGGTYAYVAARTQKGPKKTIQGKRK